MLKNRETYEIMTPEAIGLQRGTDDAGERCVVWLGKVFIAPPMGRQGSLPQARCVCVRVCVYRTAGLMHGLILCCASCEAAAGILLGKCTCDLPCPATSWLLQCNCTTCFKQVVCKAACCATHPYFPSWHNSIPLLHAMLLPTIAAVGIVLGKHSGRNALNTRLKALGYNTGLAELDDVFK